MELSCSKEAQIIAYFGHITRKEDENLEQCIITGMAEGTRERGRCKELAVMTARNGHICQ